MKNIFRTLLIVILLGAFTVPTAAFAQQPGWQNIGGSINKTVWAASVDPSGNLYLGGDFTVNPAGSPVGYTTRLVAGTWETQGHGTDGTVLSLFSLDAKHIYTGGVFSNIIRDTVNKKVNRIVQFDSAGWEYVGAGANNNVWAVAGNNKNNIYIGGDFTKVTNYDGKSTGAYRIAKWNGTIWSNMKAGMNGTVRALAVAPDGKVYAGGTFTLAGTTKVLNIAMWNGKNWEALGAGVNGGVRALQVDNNGKLIVGGNFTQAGGAAANGLAVWNGSTWSTFGTGVTSNASSGTVYSIQVAANNDIYIGGTFLDVNGVRVNNVAKWNGSTWSAIGNGIKDNVYAIALDKVNNKLYAAGAFTADGNGLPLNRVAVFQLP